ncbi:FadR/GntR family transcriptional regulator [Anaerotalea alkaliphila]|uniref:FadR family transcriptional regulator n=1 Tax=Anaerotalea alkaliphila TaxID=2662126 RepID=A0A7X5KN22_9FIRM|nr:FadR/GntR family transcriptional regulator [Anaerotalea alkaliphila]NDL68419.1 FadR family transcriptional regulator [Anaerotalea alkaliphila]
MYHLEKFHHKPLAESVAENIISFIIDNRLEAGSKIPNEFELAETLGVGRSTIREAIKVLVSRNILEIRRGAGTYVSEKQGVSDDPLGLTFLRDRHNLALDLVSVRLMLEPEIAALAAKNATEEDIRELVEQCDKVEAMIRKGEDHTAEDIKLHKSIAKASKNAVVENLIPVINSSVAVFVNVTQGLLSQETIETHREVVEAIRKRDVEGAKYAMTMHLIYNRRMIMQMMEEGKTRFDKKG